MDSIEDYCEVGRFIQQGFKVLDGFFFREIKSELLLYLLVNVPMFDVGNIGIHHESNQVKDQVGALAENSESREAEILEPRVVGRSCAAHSIYHLLAYLDWGRERFGVAAQNVAEIN